MCYSSSVSCFSGVCPSLDYFVFSLVSHRIPGKGLKAPLLPRNSFPLSSDLVSLESGYLLDYLFIYLFYQEAACTLLSLRSSEVFKE